MNSNRVDGKESIQLVPGEDETLKEIERAEKVAASDALEEMLDRHMDAMIELRRCQPVENTDLITSKIALSKLPDAVKRNAASLQERMRRLIEFAAERIEKRHYDSIDQVLAEDDFGFNERQRVQAFVATDKKFAVSCQSVRVCTDMFSELNRRMHEKISQAALSGDTRAEKSLLVGNAVLVYEICDFLSRFIETFRVQGLDEFERLHREMRNFSKEVLKGIEQARNDAADPGVPDDLRSSTIASAQQQERFIEAIESEWKTFMEKLETAKEQVGAVSQLLPSIRLIKQNAFNQLSVLQLAEIANVLKGNINALNAAKVALEKIELAPLPEERIRRLLGIR